MNRIAWFTGFPVSTAKSTWRKQRALSMHTKIKEYDRVIRLAHTQTSSICGHAQETGYSPLSDEVKSIDRESH